MDKSVGDLRNVLDDMFYYDFPEKLSPDEFELVKPSTRLIQMCLQRKNPKPFEDIVIIASNLNEQPQFTIYLSNCGVYSISWYKSRGRIGSIINTEYGQPATLIEVTDILVALVLEDPYDEDDDDDLH